LCKEEKKVFGAFSYITFLSILETLVAS